MNENQTAVILRLSGVVRYYYKECPVSGQDEPPLITMRFSN